MMLEWYREVLNNLQTISHLNGPIVELGAGAGFLEEFIPELIKTDVEKGPRIHQIENACSLSFASETVKSFILIGVFHHLQKPKDFLSEIQRCLMPGGQCIFIEPTVLVPQRLLCRILKHYEYFNLDVSQNWENEVLGPMTSANLALAWAVFVRDRALLEKRYPDLSVTKVIPHSLFKHLLSGGMSFIQLAPTRSLPVLNWLDERVRTRPWNRLFATTMTVVIEKSSKQIGFIF